MALSSLHLLFQAVLLNKGIQKAELPDVYPFIQARQFVPTFAAGACP
jgi:hypothetical protein